MNILKQKLNKTKDKLTLPLKRREAIKTNNAELAYAVAKQDSKHLDELQNIVINANNAELIYDFAYNVKGANITALSKAMADSENLEKILLFAKYIKNANIDILEEVFVKNNNLSYFSCEENKRKELASLKTLNAKYAYLFARDCANAHVSVLQKIVMDSLDAELIYNFARDVHGADIKALSNAIANSGNLEKILTFARSIKGANIEVLQKTIIETDDPYLICDFAKTVPNANIRVLEDKIIKLGKDEYVLDFAKSVKDANIPLLQEAYLKLIIKYHQLDFKLLHKFINEVPNTNIPLLQEAYIKLLIKEEIIDLHPWQEFINEIPNADIKLFENYVINHDKRHIYEFALGVKGANVQRLQKALENCADSYEYAIWDIYKFARDVPGARCDGEYLLGILQKINAKSSKPSSKIGASALYLARNYPTLDLKTLQNLVIANGDFCTLYDFALEVKGADIKAIETAMINNFLAITYDDFAISASYDLAKFAKNIPNANAEKITSALITYVIVTENNNGKLFENIIEASKMCTESKVSITKKIASSNNPALIYEYARKTNPDKECLSILEDAVMQTGNMFRVSLFAKFVPGANIKKLQQCVINSKDELYMFAFAEEVNGADKQLIEKQITNIDEARRRRNLIATYLSW